MYVCALCMCQDRLLVRGTVAVTSKDLTKQSLEAANRQTCPRARVSVCARACVFIYIYIYIYICVCVCVCVCVRAREWYYAFVRKMYSQTGGVSEGWRKTIRELL